MKSPRFRMGPLLLGLSLPLFFGWFLWASREPAPKTAVVRREMVFGIPFEGQLVALENLELGPPDEVGNDIWQFNLNFLAVDGKEVQAGEPVLGFDASELAKKLQEAEAERDELAKTLEKREIEIETERRNRSLTLAEAEARARKSELLMSVPEELQSRRELETTRIDRDLAQKEVGFRRRSLEGIDRAEAIELGSLRRQWELKKSRVEFLQKAVAAMTIKAPRAGMVIVRSRWNDDKFKVGDNVWRADKVVQMPVLSSLRARVEVDEAQAAQLAPGQPASFFLDSRPDREIAAEVEMITHSVLRKSATDAAKVLKVRIALKKEPEGVVLRPGMRLRGQVEQDRVAGVLALPEEAVRTDAEGLYVVAPGVFGERILRPQLGRRSRGYFEVLGGLEEGQELLLPASSAKEDA